MTLPKPCPKPDCKTPITHWYSGGDPYACTFVLDGKPCLHDDQDNPCYAPRETTSPLHLPDVDAVARKIHDAHWPTIDWDAERDDVKDECRAAARAVLDLIAAHQPVWQRVELGTLIKAGTRYRRETPGDGSYERIASSDFLTSDGGYSIDQRTVPAPTLTERIRAALDDSPESRITLDVADVEALLDMAGGEDK